MYAAFVVAPILLDEHNKPLLVAATTRVGKDSGLVGLPGGKVDKGESPCRTIIRESLEEGWLLFEPETTFYHSAIVEGRPVCWFRARGARLLRNYKEYGRIQPVPATIHSITQNVFKNEEALLRY